MIRPTVAQTAALVPYTNEEEILSYYEDIESNFQSKHGEEISDEYVEHINKALKELEHGLAMTLRMRNASSAPVKVECEAFIVEWETLRFNLQITQLDIRPCLIAYKLVEHILWRFIKAIKGGGRGLKVEGNFELYVQQVLVGYLGKFSSHGSDFTFDPAQIKRIQPSDLNLENWVEQDMAMEELPLASNFKNQEFVDDSERQYNEQFQSHMQEHHSAKRSSSASTAAKTPKKTRRAI